MQQVAQEFERRAGAGDALAVVDDEGEHSARELDAAGRRLAGSLTEAGLDAPTLLVQAENSWRAVAASLAVGRLGGMVAMISHHTTPEEFAASCEDIRPDAVLGDPGTVGRWGAGDVLPTAGSGDALEGWTVLTARGQRPLERWRGGVAIGLTSGSTGRAKAVVQSEAALRYASTRTIAAIGLEPGDPVAGIVPLSSVAAYCFGLYLPLLVGSPAVYWNRWDPAATLERMAACDVRWTMCVPTMVLQLAAAAGTPDILHRVRAVTVGGGPMSADALARTEKTLGTRILRVFGMAECLGHTTPRVDDVDEIRLGRDGRPFQGTTVRVVDETGAVLPPGTTGHVQVRGPSLFLGYAREGAVQPPQLTDDGFFPTGDLAVINDDGTISITGRAKDVIIRGGRNIDIAEVEIAIGSHPRVREVCVVSVPDELLGERVAALVIPTAGHVDLAGVTGHLAERGVAKQKWPEYVFEVDEIPQTRVGKASRRDAAQLAERLLETRLP